MGSLGAGALGGQGAIYSPPPLCARMLCSPVAHHDSVSRGRGDVLTVTPLLTASLGLESNPLADQFTLTWATWANGLHGEPCCQEFCFGGGGEVHLVKTTILWVGRQRLIMDAAALTMITRLGVGWRVVVMFINRREEKRLPRCLPRLP